MATLTLFTNPMSRGRIARWMLEEVGATYDTIYLSYGDTMKGDAYLALNPMGKVPAIKHGRAIITECAAICAYLADAFPEAGLAPPLDQRGDYYRWLFFGAGPVESATTNKMLQVSTEGHQQMAGYGDFDTTLQTLTQAVSQTPFICGETFTAADVYLGSQIGWGLQFGTIPVSPELEAYRDRVYARPAHARANALDDSAMAEHGPTIPNDA
ncbi:MAG: glutathione S-transferase family protein [Pseudomonadota bacterium]